LESNLIIKYPESTDDWELNRWRTSLNFYGFTDAVLEEVPGFGEDKEVVFQALTCDHTINLREIDLNKFLNSQNRKYSYLDQYFDFQVISKK